MKKLLTLTFALALLVCLFAFGSLTASAATSGDYKYTVSNGVATITDYYGDGGDVTIPSTLGGYPVTTIGDEAFYDCDSLTSVTIPNSVKTIGASAFLGCDSLTSVTIGNSVTTIGNEAFYSCDSLTSVTIPNSVKTIGNSAFISCSSLKTVTIPDSVTTIGDSAFFWCTSLTSVTIGNSVTSIGNEAFYSCDSLTSVTIPNSVKTIGASAFLGCDSLTSVTIGNSVTTIGNEAFYSCDSLTSVTIPDSVTTIGELAFSSCDALASVMLGNSVKTIGDFVFAYCSSLTNISVASDNPNFSAADGVLFNKDKTKLIVCSAGKSGSYTIPGSVTTIGVEAFFYCESLTSVTIPNSVTTIGEYAFGGCSSMISVSISNSVTSIGDWMFAGCSSLTSVTIPNSVKTIGDWAFGYCESLTSVTIPDSVTTIGDYAFYDCFSMTSVTIPNSVKTIGVEAFYNCESLADVYYSGGEADRRKISVDSSNNYLTNATWYYDCSFVTIITQPNSVCVANGEKATVKVVARGDGLRYRWFYKDAGASEYTFTSSFTGNSYSVTMTDARAGRRVMCQVYDKYGNMVMSSSALLNQTVRITKQPSSVCVANGEKATVTVTATGYGLTYKWYVSDVGDTRFYLTSMCTNTCSMKMTDSIAGRKVYCIITDQYGNKVQTKTVTLNQPVKITTQPKSVCVANGAKATVKVVAKGDGLTYRWYYKDKGMDAYKYTSSFKGNSYSITMTDARAGRRVLCRVYDQHGNVVKSSSVSLNQEVRITKQPVSVTVTKGATAKVTVTAKGDGLNYYWYYKDKGMDDFAYTTSFTGKTYSVSMTKARAGRQVCCIITDKYGKSVQSNIVTLKMK